MDDILEMMGPEEPSKPKWQGALEDILWTVVAGAVTRDPLAYPKFKMQQEHVKAAGKTAQLERLHKVLQIREAMDKRTAERKPFRIETGIEEYEIPGGGVEGAGGEYDTPTPGKEVKRARPAYTDMGISMGEAKMLGSDALNRLMEARGIGKGKGQKPHGQPWFGTDNKLFRTITDEKGNVRDIPITTTTREVDPNVGLTEDNLGLQDLVKVVTKQQVREKEKREDRPPPSPWPSDQGLMTWKKVDGEWVATPVTVPEEPTPSMESTNQFFRKPEAEIPSPGKRQLGGKKEKVEKPRLPLHRDKADPKTGITWRQEYEDDAVTPKGKPYEVKIPAPTKEDKPLSDAYWQKRHEIYRVARTKWRAKQDESSTAQMNRILEKDSEGALGEEDKFPDISTAKEYKEWVTTGKKPEVKEGGLSPYDKHLSQANEALAQGRDPAQVKALFKKNTGKDFPEKKKK